VKIGLIRDEDERTAGSSWLTALTVILSLTVFADSAAAQDVLAKSAPLAVELSNRTITIVPGAGPDGPIATVKLDGRSFTVPMGDDIAAWHGAPDPKAATHIQGDYLFIDSYNGGNGWRSEKRNIFAIRNSELVHLGDVASDIPDPSPDLTRQLHNAHRFLDVDNQLEDNRLTSHAEAPSVLVALKDQGDTLAYDPAWCWRLNAADYKDRAARLATAAPGADFDTEFPALILMTVIDKYCGRTTQLRDDLSQARSRLKNGDYRMLVSLVYKLEVGKRPDH